MKAALLAGFVALTVAAPASAVTFTAADYQAAARALDTMRGLNLTVFGDMQAGHDIEGKAYIGGNVTGNSFTAGLGHAANGQSAAANDYVTLTVGGTARAFNLNNGAGASNNYGATIGGNSAGFTINDAGAVVRIGGDVASDLSLASRQGQARAADVSIRGYVNSVTAQASGSTVRVGSVSGGANKIQVGDNATVTTASGNVGLVTAGAGSSIRLGGSVDQIRVGNNSTTTVRGNVGQNGATIGSGSSFASGGNVGGLDLGANSSATISGNVGPNLNLSSNDTVKIGGQYLSQNVNGLQSGTTVAVSGASQSQNRAPAGWSFNTGAVYAAPDAPAAPDVPTTASLAAVTTDLKTNSVKLSDVLASLYAETANTVVFDAVNKDYTFRVANAAANTTRGYVAFNVDAAFLNARNIGFDLTNASNLPIVINVTGLGSGTWNWNGGLGAGYGASVNQQVIWNLVGATGTINFQKIVHGSVLAPNARITNITPIEGSVVAQSFGQGGEVHLGTFRGAGSSAFLQNGNPLAAVPEPGVWAQLVAGFGLLGVAARRRRKGMIAAA